MADVLSSNHTAAVRQVKYLTGADEGIYTLKNDKNTVF